MPKPRPHGCPSPSGGYLGAQQGNHNLGEKIWLLQGLEGRPGCSPPPAPPLTALDTSCFQAVGQAGRRPTIKPWKGKGRKDGAVIYFLG